MRPPTPLRVSIDLPRGGYGYFLELSTILKPRIKSNLYSGIHYFNIGKNRNSHLLQCFRTVMDKRLTPSPWTTPMDYPNGLPKWTTLKWTTLKKSYFEWVVLEEPLFLYLHCMGLLYVYPHGHFSA